MDIRELNELRKKNGWTYREIAERSGVPLSTVQKVFGGSTAAPRPGTLQKIERALRMPRGGYAPVPSGSMIREAQPAYGSRRTGPYTTDDYYALPDDVRMELIDGWFYDMASPGGIHQAVILSICAQLYYCGRKHMKAGGILPSPSDVRLDGDSRTMVQPDILGFRSRKNLTGRYYDGAPDLVIEILSPSSRKYDLYLKTEKYYTAGVEEYWIVDPEARTVMVHLLKDNYLPVVYRFDGKVPVAISDGACEVDFTLVAEDLDLLEEIPGAPESVQNGDAGSSRKPRDSAHILQIRPNDPE